MKEIFDRKKIPITVYFKNGILTRRLEIPGRGFVEGPAEPEGLCEEGVEVFDDLTRRYRGTPDGEPVFQGNQYYWEEIIINRLLGSRGQYVNWDRE